MIVVRCALTGFKHLHASRVGDAALVGPAAEASSDTVRRRSADE
jgi:hypothetical protein